MAIFLNVPLNENNMRFFLSQLECRRCGKCCQNAIVRPFEVQAIAEYLNTTKAQVKKLYTHTVDGQRFLNAPCPFLKDHECTIYAARPQVCIQFPFNQAYEHPTKGKYMTVFECPAGKEIGDRFGVKV